MWFMLWSDRPPDVLQRAIEGLRQLEEQALLFGRGRQQRRRLIRVLPGDQLADAAERVVEILRQLEEKSPPIVSLKLAFLIKNLVDSSESRDVARFIEQMVETKILQ